MPRPQTPPAPLLVLGAIASVQFGGALAATLIPRIGAGGSVLLRLVLGAVLMLALVRPTIRGHDRGSWRTVLIFGLVLAAMNFTFYASLAYLPIGVAVTIEFIGPLALSAWQSRKPLDLLAVLAAAAGVVLISQALSVPLEQLSWAGLGLAFAAGCCWAAYIVWSGRTGAAFPALDGLAIAMCVAALAVTPLGAASMTRATGQDLATGLGIAILSSVLPYSLELIALRTMSSQVFGIMLSLEPAAAALAGLVILGQRLTALQLAGMALVVIASAIVLGKGSRSAPASD